MNIRESKESDKPDVFDIHTLAFGQKEGPEVAELAKDLFDDRTADPGLSLVAVENNRLIGHIMFTKATLSEHDDSIKVQLLAPLAVRPEFQKKGNGGHLVKEGLKRLKASGTQLVFVLGHPEYYPKFGFVPAGALGFSAPYPIPEENADAWMVLELVPGIIGKVHGQVNCSDAMDHPRNWR